MTLISTEDEIFKFAEKKKADMNPMNLHYIFKELMIELEEKKKKSEREQKKQRQRLVRGDDKIKGMDCVLICEKTHFKVISQKLKPPFSYKIEVKRKSRSS
jgi:hypothetical protein